MTKQQVLVLLSALVLVAPATYAAGAGWYGGAGGGWTKAKGGATGIDPDLTAEGGTATHVDDSDTGWKVYGGYQFNPNFAMEGSYVNLGKFTVDATIPGGTENAEVKPDAWCAAAVGILPLPQNFSLLGKVGGCRWDDHSRIVETIGATMTEEIPQSTGTDVMYGVGAKYDFTPNFGARLEWERYENVIHNSNGVDLWSGSLQYSF
jgi:OOP family OmpA-OmpF porin